MVLEAIVSIFELIKTPIAEYVVPPMKRHLSYAFRWDSKVQNLEEAVVQLKDKKERVENDVDQATGNGEEIYQNVSSWLETVKNDIHEADELIQRKEEVKKERCVGVCPNLKTRYRLGKKADKKASVIGKLVRDAEGFNQISFFRPLEQIVEPSVFNREALSSRLQILDQVMDALKDPQLNVIGVYGMGGVGKTTLAKEVLAKAKQEKMFDNVVFVVVSQTPEVKRIQTEIAELLGMKFDVEEVPARASRLNERLKKSKVLIILDDLWDKLHLTTIGIESGDALKGCKLFLTSRSMDVLRIKMQTQKEFPLGVLGEKEAWTLFQKMAPRSEDILFRDIATEVAKKCSGLPLLIIIVANELQNKDLYAWKDMLKRLSGDIQRSVHKVLKSSFENLPGDEIQSLFLLCSLFAQSNIQIQCLLIYCMGLGLFENTDTVQEARDRLLTLISKLKAECLLLDGDMDGFVKMHDVVRDVAISIASGLKHAFVGAGHVQLVDKLDQKTCTKISLPYCNVSELPSGLKCPKVDLFLLFTEDLSLKINDSFFKGIRKLKVVGFTGMRLVSLPSSLGLLTNLHTLSLHKCQLNNVVVVGELKKLELLSFSDSKIDKLPREIEELTKLKLLDLSNCTMLRVIPANIFSKLCLLEELYMLNSFDRWDMKGIASLMELKNLSQLSTLEIQIVSPKLEGFRFFDSLKLQCFKISVGNIWYWDGKYGTSNTLIKLKLEPGIRLDHGISMLLRRAQDLYVDEVRGDVDVEGFQHLKHLHIESDSDNIQHLFKSKVQASRQAFVFLESLYLNNLESLESIYDGQLATGSFGNLQKLIVSRCHKLKKLFSFSPAKCLSQLREMELNFCHGVESIVGDRTEDGHYSDEVIKFSQMNSLKLKHLSNLRCFLKKNVGNQQIDSLFNEMVSFPNLTSLEVSFCKSLKYIFTSSAVECLVKLKKLRITICELVEEIVVAKKIEEIEEDSIHKIAFPKLDYLSISGLTNLKSFCHGHVIEFPLLETLSLDRCCAMQNFVSSSSNNGSDGYFFNEMVAFSNLEIMDVSHMDNLRDLWDEKATVNDSFFKLKSLTISECPLLRIIFPSNLYRRFLKLETLDISRCGGVEEIYPYDVENIEEAFALRDLCISGLVSLKYIWSKDSCRAATCKRLQSVLVDGCPNLKYVFPESVACDLVQLQRLDIENCSVETVVAGKSKNGPPSLEFPEDLNEMRSLCEGAHTLELPNLKSLEVRGCPEIMKFGSDISDHIEDENGKDNLPLTRSLFVGQKLNLGVEKLKIDNHGFKSIGGGALSAELFSRLKNVTLYRIEEEFIHFLFSFLKRLRSLEKLVLKNGSLKEISLFNDDDDEQATGEQQHYPRLKHLKLQYLPELKHITKKGSQANRVLQYLQMLTTKNCEGLRDTTLHSTSFQNLTTLYLYSCNNVTKLVTSSTAKTMVRLMRIKVERCSAIEEIIADYSSSIEHEVIIFNKLTCLELLDLRRINSFCSGNHTIVFPQLDQVTVKCCFMMKNFCGGVICAPKLQGVRLDGQPQWDGDLNSTIASRYWVFPTLIDLASFFPSFQNLTTLEVDKCNQLAYLMTISVAKSMGQLEKLSVRDCELLMEIIGNGNDGARDDIVFNKMKILELSDLQSLQSFYSGSCAFEFSCLENFYLERCPNLKIFCAGTLKTPMLYDVKHGNMFGHRCYWKGDMNSTIQYLHTEMVGFDGLYDVQLTNFPMLKGKWGDQISFEYFHWLRKLVVDECASLSSAISQNLLQELVFLKELKVEKCESVEQVFDLEGMNAYEFSINRMNGLDRLQLIDLPSLRLVWSKDPQQFLSFTNLKLFKVQNCGNLTYIFDLSIASRLPKLEHVEVKNCSLVEHIIVKGEEETMQKYRKVFPSLQSIGFQHLTNLSSFCFETGILECPSLKVIEVVKCPKMDLFPSILLSNGKSSCIDVEEKEEIVTCEEPDSQLSFLGNQIAVPILEELKVNWNSLKHIFSDNDTPDILPRLKRIELIGFEDEHGILPPNFLQVFPKLEKLSISDALIEEMNLHELIPLKKNPRSLGFFKKLKLSKLKKLKHLVHDDNTHVPPFRDLEDVEVVECSSLNILLPPSASFQNLTNLQVSECDSLMHLMTISTAGSLEQLKKMIVKECKMMQEIIAGGSQGGDFEIHFSQLEHLELDGLACLESFCSGNNEFHFPALEEVVVMGCPNMKNFACSETPNLEKVKTGKHKYKREGVHTWDWEWEWKWEWEWEGDLNNTIQAMHAAKVAKEMDAQNMRQN